MKKGLKIAAITVGVIIILMLLLPFAFQGKIADIVKTEGNKMLNVTTCTCAEGAVGEYLYSLISRAEGREV